MQIRKRLEQLWHARSPSEKRGLSILLALVLPLLVWQSIAPAWRQLRTSQVQTPLLEAQYQDMLRLQAQAQLAQAQAPLTREQAQQALLDSLATLGDQAQAEVQGSQITVTLKAVAPAALAQWLSQVRLDAQLTPSQAQLARQGASSWGGSVVIPLNAP